MFVIDIGICNGKKTIDWMNNRVAMESFLCCDGTITLSIKWWQSTACWELNYDCYCRLVWSDGGDGVICDAIANNLLKDHYLQLPFQVSHDRFMRGRHWFTMAACDRDICAYDEDSTCRSTGETNYGSKPIKLKKFCKHCKYASAMVLCCSCLY